MRLNSSASAPSSSRLVVSIRWSSAPEPILAAAAWIDSIGRTSRRASTYAGRARRAEEGDEQERRAPDRRLERRECLAQRLLDEDVPAERVDRLVRAQDLRAVLVAPDRRRVGVFARAEQRRAHLRQRREVGVPEEEVAVRMGDRARPGESTAYAYPAVPIARARRHLADEREVDLGHHDTASAARSATAIDMCGCEPPAGSRRARSTASPLAPPRNSRLCASVDPAAGAVGPRAGRPNLLPSRPRRGTELAEELLPPEEAVEVLFPLDEARPALSRRSAARPSRAPGRDPASAARSRPRP